MEDLLALHLIDGIAQGSEVSRPGHAVSVRKGRRISSRGEKRSGFLQALHEHVLLRAGFHFFEEAFDDGEQPGGVLDLELSDRARAIGGLAALIGQFKGAFDQMVVLLLRE